MKMPDYEKMYFELAARVADAIEELEALMAALIGVQQKCEDMYIEGGEGEA